MPRKPKKQAPQPEAAKPFDEFADESESLDDDAVGADSNDQLASDKMRDWRDVEKYKEERALRRMIDDELDFDELDRKPGMRARR